MEIHERLENWKMEAGPAPREEKVRQTVQKAALLCFWQEEARYLTYGEFLWTQLSYTRKRWWALQAVFLALAYLFLSFIETDFFRLRSIGVIGCLFVVFTIPELWRNKQTHSIHVEAACLYSLRQVYSARITLFAAADMVLLTAFCAALDTLGFTLVDMMSQFLLPVTVTACICFSLLCGKANLSETVSLTICLIWSGAWWLILMNEALYSQVLPSVWAALLVMALVFLVLTVRRTVREANQYWEVEFV